MTSSEIDQLFKIKGQITVKLIEATALCLDAPDKVAALFREAAELASTFANEIDPRERRGFCSACGVPLTSTGAEECAEGCPREVAA